MLPFGSLPWFELARFRRSRLTRAALVAVAIVPLFYGVLYVWANWNPTGHLDHVQAAVVNQDSPATITGPDGRKTVVPLGRSLAGKLTAGGNSENFDWVLTTAADASKGLRDGTYAAQLIIPKDFSAAATSTSGDASKAVQARLSLQTDDAQNYLSGTIARQVGQAATDALNAQVSAGYLSNVYVGFSTLHGQLGDAADGATQLSSGAGQLADGAGQLDRGTGQLVVGLNQLADGTAQLPGQTAQLNSGAQQIAGGAGQLATGAKALSSGLGRLSAGTAGLPGQTRLLDAGAAGLDTGASRLATGAGQVATGAGNVATGSGFVSSGLTNLGAQLNALAASCAASGASAAFCAQITAAASGTSTLTTAATGVTQGATFVRAAAGQVSTGARQLATGAGQLHTGTSALAAGAPALSGGISQSASGATQLSTGATRLSTGATQLASGTAQLAGAAPQLSSGIAQAAGGAQQLQTGTGKLSTGAQKLGTGSGRLADGLRDGASQVPNYTSAQRQRLSAVAATPVVTNTSRLHDVKTYGAGFAPYFMALALWVGAMAIFMLLRALSPRSLASTASSPRVALAGYWPGAVMAGVQAVLLVLVLYFAVGLTPARLPVLFLFAILISLTFAAINQALIATFGGAGRFVALILISLQLTTAGGTYPIDTAPAFFSALHPFLPMTYAVDGLRTAIAGGGAGLGRDVVVLLVWAAIGFAITFLAAHRQRTWSVARLHATAIV
jgi:putative membrane protein